MRPAKPSAPRTVDVGRRRPAGTKNDRAVLERGRLATWPQLGRLIRIGLLDKAYLGRAPLAMSWLAAGPLYVVQIALEV